MKIILMAQVFFVLGCKVNVGTNENEQFKVIPFTSSVSFNDISLYVLTPSCVRCHAWASDENAINQRIIMGDPENSVLYQRIKSGSMPPTRALSSKEIELIERFIMTAKKAPPEEGPSTTPIIVEPEIIAINSTFKSVNYHLIQKSCLTCHNNQSKEISFEGYAHIKRHASEIIDILDIGEMEGTPMPPYDDLGKRKAPVPGQQVIEAFRAWIDEGKLEN